MHVSHSKTRFLLRLFFLLCAAVSPTTFSATVAYAQADAEGGFPSIGNQLQTILEKGEKLESEQRWGEALSCYENAYRTNPRNDLKDRITRARTHYDLTRRYHDESFVTAVKKMDQAQVANLYAEILRKIHTHYVTQPDWNQLTMHGISNLLVALDKKSFVNTNVPKATDSQIIAFQAEVRKQMADIYVRDRYQSRQVADYFARLGTQRLGLPAQATIMEFACGAMCGLDQYSSFLTGGQLEDVFSQIEGNFVGLGIELKAHQRALAIVDVIGNSPADQAGLRAGDRIIRVDGTSTVDVSTDQAADLLKGPEGSVVELIIKDTADRTRSVRLVRRRVEVPSVEDVAIVDKERGVGYLRLTNFQKSTSQDVEKALWRLHAQGMQSLIVDLRGNPGGLLNSSVEVADKFLPAGAIVSTRGRSSREDFDYQAKAARTWQLPLIVLIDENTASASEIFAGAIRDNRRGVVIGQRSYGKGSVQGIFPLDTAKVGVRLTTAKFYSPSGQAISNRGVSPDVVVRTVNKPADEPLVASRDEEDPTLQQALEYARTQIERRIADTR